jgi:phenylalanyl-tRNA synthetase alpha chain
MKIRFRPSYFPFVEPGVEVDIEHVSSRGTKWLEVMGAGMVHPSVLTAAGFDAGKWQGFAFGTGIERLVMIKYEIDDVRLFHNGDLRFVNQF